MDKSFCKYMDAQNYAERIIEAMRKGNIFAEDLITFDTTGDSTTFRVDSRKLVDKITNIMNNPLPGQMGNEQPGLPDFRSLYDLSDMQFNMNMSIAIPESAYKK